MSENARQAVVDSLASDDFEGTAYDDLTRQAAEICEAEFAVISVVDGVNLWFRNRAGVEPLQRPRAQSFCDHAITNSESVTVVADAASDPRFADNPNVVGEPHLRFYAGVPLVYQGQPIGTLCAFGGTPHNLDAGRIEQLRFLARQVMVTLEERHRSTG